MKRFIVFVILGGIAVVMLNALSITKFPEPSFVVGTWIGGLVSICWRLVVSVFKLIYAVLSLCFAMIWLLGKVSVMIIVYPLVFIAILIIGLVCVIFFPQTSIKIPPAFSRKNFKKLMSPSKRISESGIKEESK